jgi:quinol monooxygenase YgiN
MAASIKTSQTTLLVTIRIDPDNIEEFLRALRPCWEACSQEPECIYFEIFHSEAEPGLFRFVEIWTKDEEWFREHQLTKPYYGPYEAITNPMLLEPKGLDFFNRAKGWSYVDKEYLSASVKT